MTLDELISRAKEAGFYFGDGWVDEWGGRYETLINPNGAAIAHAHTELEAWELAQDSAIEWLEGNKK